VRYRIFGRHTGLRVSELLWEPGCSARDGGRAPSPMKHAAPEPVVKFYNSRGTAEQWIKEGKHALRCTRLSCHARPQ
jgi:hypothetical protein